MRVHFVNENIGGHATMHAHLRSALADEGLVTASYFDVPPRHGLERLAGAAIPGLASLDADFQPLRAQLARSAVVRQHLTDLGEPQDALHLYTHNAALLSVGHMRRIPSIVSLDATNRQNAHNIPGRRPTAFTAATIAASVPFERRVYAAARRVVAHSLWCADSVLSYGVEGAKIEIVPFGITAPPQALPRPERPRPRIVFVGTSMERKGGWRLLDLWRRSLAGATELTLVTLEAVPPAEGLTVRNDVRLGDGKIETILADADIFAMPSAIDSFGYAVLEAMAASLPVVAVARGAIPELVADGETGILVAPGDDDAFAAALRSLASDAGARRELGAAGRRRFAERFDARKTTADLIDIIREAAGS